MRKRERERENKIEKKRRGVRSSSSFSQYFMEIGPSVLVGKRSKVGPRNESYAWIPKSVDFSKLREVENFPTLFISSLKGI